MRSQVLYRAAARPLPLAFNGFSTNEPNANGVCAQTCALKNSALPFSPFTSEARPTQSHSTAQKGFTEWFTQGFTEGFTEGFTAWLTCLRCAAQAESAS